MEMKRAARSGIPSAMRSFDQFDATRNALQHVVEVMRDAAGQLTDRFHFLCLVQAFLTLPQRSIGCLELG